MRAATLLACSAGKQRREPYPSSWNDVFVFSFLALLCAVVARECVFEVGRSRMQKSTGRLSLSECAVCERGVRTTRSTRSDE